MTPQELLSANRRWTILKLMAGDFGHQVEIRMIQRGILTINPAHAVGVDQIRKDLRWLEAKFLIELVIEDELVFAKLLQRGADVAAGVTRIDGVDKPPLED